MPPLQMADSLRYTHNHRILKASHNVVQELSVPASDFLTKHGIILDVEQGAYHAKHASQSGALLLERPHSCMLVLDSQAVPTLRCTDRSLDMPADYHPAVSHVLQATIFKQDLGHTAITGPVPTSVKEVRSFLGLSNFYQHFIPKFADIAAPLTALTVSRTAFKWEHAQLSAFTALQQILVSPQILDYP